MCTELLGLKTILITQVADGRFAAVAWKYGLVTHISFYFPSFNSHIQSNRGGGGGQAAGGGGKMPFPTPSPSKVLLRQFY